MDKNGTVFPVVDPGPVHVIVFDVLIISVGVTVPLRLRYTNAARVQEYPRGAPVPFHRVDQTAPGSHVRPFGDVVDFQLARHERRLPYAGVNVGLPFSCQTNANNALE